ncbi:Holliday junction resolvasome RuvABC endonuclease subunit [Pseudonocardia sediminis]|uniref:Holliday junction resolvasome RuvABC endonuclease subunit n=1 Tax=Pseudonocardia sediminis TaxID=1397368 RepID=A0A4Q7V0B1_PSEST|nr:crossover junction endodeoxyribonuclease RuvC [Pseudonocardia sediminis]RZT87515.1 Holliday junction resolvasome RuvABC endonuclease subunit [Pseudonocardia sediminis]
MRVLGIDLSLTRTGVGIIDHAEPQCVARAEIVESSGRRAESLLDRDRRLYRIAAGVLEHATDDTTLVGIEMGVTARVAGGSLWDRAGCWWRIVHALHRRNVRVVSVNPATLKKWATGRGNADKSDVSVAMARLWPDVDSPSNDGWDGLAAASMCAQHLEWPVPSRAHHAESLARVDWLDGRKAS